MTDFIEKIFCFRRFLLFVGFLKSGGIFGKFTKAVPKKAPASGEGAGRAS
jgi:hypothetical protein